MDEYVEREKVENWLLTESASLDTQVDRECVVERMREDIPAVDVRPVVRSQWIKMKFFPNWECKKCGRVISEKMPDPWNHYHFCPKCGADMRGRTMRESAFYVEGAGHEKH